MYKQRFAAFVLVMLMSVLLITTTPPVRSAKFVIASWDYPDEYGQGIELLTVYENSTGSWVGVGGVHEYDQTFEHEWNESVFIKLRVYSFFNSTFTGAVDVEDGKNYQQHSVTVTDNLDTVFSQQNFTYYSNSTVLDPMWYYGYEVVLNFLPLGGEIYTVTITYDIYGSFDSQTITPTVAADSDDTNWEDSTNENARTVDFVAAFQSLYREYWFRIALPIPQDKTIFSATAYFYAVVTDTASEGVRLQRSTEIDLGSMEADSSKPSVTAVNESSGTWASGTGWFSVSCLDLIQDFVNDGSWSNNSYAGFRLYDYDETDDGNGVEDYQHADTHHTYISITHGSYDWNEVSILSLIFPVPFDEWGMNTALIILGLVMIPTSTIYLAYGAKHDRSSDRLFYGLIIFILGCGLFIGGVIPP